MSRALAGNWAGEGISDEITNSLPEEGEIRVVLRVTSIKEKVMDDDDSSPPLQTVITRDFTFSANGRAEVAPSLERWARSDFRVISSDENMDAVAYHSTTFIHPIEVDIQFYLVGISRTQ